MKLVFALLILAAGARAQQERFHEQREQTIPGVGRLIVDPGNNLGVTVRGSLRNDISIRSSITARAHSLDDARAIAGMVRVDASVGQIKAPGPALCSWWVMYEISVPQSIDLSMTRFNGGINVSDVRGRIEFNAKNGGVRLPRVAGHLMRAPPTAA
jgi:hypothetical protein